MTLMMKERIYLFTIDYGEANWWCESYSSPLPLIAFAAPSVSVPSPPSLLFAQLGILCIYPQEDFLQIHAKSGSCFHGIVPSAKTSRSRPLNHDCMGNQPDNIFHATRGGRYGIDVAGNGNQFCKSYPKRNPIEHPQSDTAPDLNHHLSIGRQEWQPRVPNES